MGMVFAALAFGAATLVEINVMVRTNQHKHHLHFQTGAPVWCLENRLSDPDVVTSLFLHL